MLALKFVFNIFIYKIKVHVQEIKNGRTPPTHGYNSEKTDGVNACVGMFEGITERGVDDQQQYATGTNIRIYI